MKKVSMKPGNLIIVLTNDPVSRNVLPFGDRFRNIELNELAMFNPYLRQ
jgi:hypothetical protein